MRVIMTCAGTAGHINPAIAIANLIKENYASSEIIFIGTKTGMENDLVKNAGYDIYSIRTGKLLRKLTLKNVSAINQALLGIKDAKKIIKDFNPDLVIGTGGYICVTVMNAAKALKVPYILHESNAFPGLAVKLTAKNAYRVFLGFEDARKRLKNQSNLVYTGNISKIDGNKFANLDKEDCKKSLNLGDISSKIVLVTFGSQGAKYLNDYILQISKKQNKDILYILITGNNNYDEVMSKVEDIEKNENIDMSKFLKVERFVYDMDKMYKVADLCITRAGAMTINELEVTNLKSILIPLPTATENHQYYNARVLEEKGMACIIEQKDLTVDILYEKVLEYINKPEGSRNFDIKEQNQDVNKKILNELEIFQKSLS